MSSKPTHFAYVVTPAKEGSDSKPYWTKIGTVFAHTKGDGFDLVIPAGISVSGRIVCTAPRADTDTATSA